jgi:colicin import membrane protein
MQEATPATERLQRDAFAPPPERGLGPAATLAILVHLALLLCLSWVVKWRDQPVILTAQAELWAKLPPQTEPEPVPPSPPAEPAPQPAPPPPPPPPAKAKAEPVKPAPKAEPAPPPKVINDKLAEADIAEQKKKAKKLADEQAQKLALEEEAARKQKEKEEAEAAVRKQKEKEETEATARKQKERDDAEAAVRKQKEKEEAEATARKQKEEAARKERERQRKDQEDRIAKIAKESEIKEQTEDLKKRIVQKADADSNAPETASKSVGKPSDKYIASIQAAIRPNITFTDALAGNPAVEIHVRLASDGAIISSAIVNSSGIKSWDTAAMRALDKTERLPKDENGRVPPTMTITLRPRDR